MRLINYGDVLGDKKNTKYEVRCKEYYSFYELKNDLVIALSHYLVVSNKSDKIIESSYQSFYANEHYVFGEDMSYWLTSPDTDLSTHYPTKEEEDLVIRLYERYLMDSRDVVTKEIMELDI